MDVECVIRGGDLTSCDNSEADLLPCHLNSDVELKSNLFRSSIRAEEGYVCASLRGRPLAGQLLSLPKGIIGCVVEKIIDEDESTDNLILSEKFTKFTYWNLDSIPSKDDSIVQALKWTEIAESIHSMDTS